MMVLLPRQGPFSDVVGSIEGGRTDWNIKPLIDYGPLCGGFMLLNCSSPKMMKHMWVKCARAFEVVWLVDCSVPNVFIGNYGPWPRPAIDSPLVFRSVLDTFKFLMEMDEIHTHLILHRMRLLRLTPTAWSLNTTLDCHGSSSLKPTFVSFMASRSRGTSSTMPSIQLIHTKIVILDVP